MLPGRSCFDGKNTQTSLDPKECPPAVNIISKPQIVLTYNFLAWIFRCDGNPASWALIIILQPDFNTNGTEDMIVDTDYWVADL